MLPALLLAMALTGGAPDDAGQGEVIADIRIQGNLLTSDEEVRRIAGVDIGVALAVTTIEEAGARLRAAKRFERVEVLKRFASIADPTRIALVIIVDEGPVHIVKTGDPTRPTRVVRNRGPGLLFLPLLDSEDGYGLTYGVRVTWPNPLGARSRLSVPMTWGGSKRVAVEIDQTIGRGPLSRAQAGASIGHRDNPYFDEDDGRARVWVRGERNIGRVVRAGATGGWQRVAFAGSRESFPFVGADVAIDTRLDPALPRNAVYARASWERLGFSGRPTHRHLVEGRGYLGLIGQNTLVVRAVREDANQPLPPAFQPLLGGMANLRGFRAGTDAGDTLVAGSIEFVAPLTSPLHIGKLGVSVFGDAGTVYDSGQRLADEPFKQSYGGSVWFSAAFLRLTLAVARGVGASTRVHLGGGVSF